MSDLSQSPKESIKVAEGEIRLIKQPDGNWKGYLNRDGNPLEVRDIDPYTCLTKLLTHP
jgi:hypothetical protein